MIRSLACLAALVATISGGVGAADYRLRDETTERRTLRFSGREERSLTVRNINGSIRVVGSRGSEAQLDVHRIVHADSDADLRRGQQAATLTTTDQRADVEVVVHDPDSSVCGESNRGARGRWRGEPPYRIEYNLTVSVPDNTRLVLCTINGREIDVSDTRGDFLVDNVNGRIMLRNVRGSGNATTVNGRIEATLLEVPTQDMQFKTVNGEVSVTWPSDLSADLHLKTMNGGIFTDFDVTSLAAVTRPGARRDGRFVYRSNNTATVRVGRGGPQVNLESLNGDVRVLRASR